MTNNTVLSSGTSDADAMIACCFARKKSKNFCLVSLSVILAHSIKKILEMEYEKKKPRVIRGAFLTSDHILMSFLGVLAEVETPSSSKFALRSSMAVANVSPIPTA